jgi:serine/threonine-protein kinase
VDDPFGLQGQTLERKYEVRAVVAQGGFGVLYRGHHRTLDQPLAIKVLKVPVDMQEPARRVYLDSFANEAKVIARLDHPAIVRVLDYGVSVMPNGIEAPWMVLQWCEGQTLAEALKARRGRGGRSPAEALGLLKPVFEALAFAHAQGVAHRDVKPANVMLLRPSGVKLLDFGIAKVMVEGAGAPSGDTHTAANMAMFSLPYAAPEQVGATRTGPWTDVHALGLVLTEVLTDRAPYTGADATAMLAQVLRAERPTPARFGVDVGPWEPLIARALSFQPQGRFADAGVFLAALEAELHAVIPVTVAALPPPGAIAETEPAVQNSTLKPISPPAGSPRREGLVARRPRLVAVVLGALVAVILGVPLWLYKRPAPAVERPAPPDVSVSVARTAAADVLGVPEDAAPPTEDADGARTDAEAPAAPTRRGDGGRRRSLRRRPDASSPPDIMTE